MFAKPYNTIIFDMDGTLVYTKPEFKTRVVHQTLRELGITTSHTEEDIERFWFVPERSETISKYFKADPKKFWPVYSKISEAVLSREHIEPYSDIKFLKLLSERGCKMGIVTENSRKNTDFLSGLISEIVGYNPFGAVVSTFSDGHMPKPHPDSIQECLKRLGAGNKALLVGNGPEDIGAAINTGITSCLIDRGEYQFSIQPSPSISIKSLYELEQFI